jgi:hypothetical protein
MVPRKQLVIEESAKAIKMRQSLGIGILAPICPYDLAEQLGVEVRFVDITSMEGMYFKTSNPHILLSSHRPPGRQAFNCSHARSPSLDMVRIDGILSKPTKSRYNTEGVG